MRSHAWPLPHGPCRPGAIHGSTGGPSGDAWRREGHAERCAIAVLSHNRLRHLCPSFSQSRLLLAAAVEQPQSLGHLRLQCPFDLACAPPSASAAPSNSPPSSAFSSSVCKGDTTRHQPPQHHRHGSRVIVLVDVAALGLPLPSSCLSACLCHRRRSLLAWPEFTVDGTTQPHCLHPVLARRTRARVRLPRCLQSRAATHLPFPLPAVRCPFLPLGSCLQSPCSARPGTRTVAGVRCLTAADAAPKR